MGKLGKHTRLSINWRTSTGSEAHEMEVALVIDDGDSTCTGLVAATIVTGDMVQRVRFCSRGLEMMCFEIAE